MVQQNIDFIGGGFKLTLPYTFGGWVLWVLGLVITGFGVVAAMSDPVGLACPSSVWSSWRWLLQEACRRASQMRKRRCRPRTFKKKEQSGYTVTLVPPAKHAGADQRPERLDSPCPRPADLGHRQSVWAPRRRYAALRSIRPRSVPQPATMTTHLIFAGTAAILTLVVGAVMIGDEEAELGATPALIIAGLGFILLLVNYFRAKALRQMLDTPTSWCAQHPWATPNSSAKFDQVERVG